MIMFFFIRYLLSNGEVSNLREGLKKKWEAVNKEYQSITHIFKIDTIGLKRKYCYQYIY